MVVASVIIPVYNDAAGLQLCLEALSRVDGADRMQVVVVDNGSAEPVTVDGERHPRVQVIREEKPGSYAARNAGVRIATGEFLFFIDSDCTPAADWLQSLLSYFARHPEVDFAGGWIRMTGGGQGVAATFERLFSFRQDQNFGNGYSVTANLAVRRDAFSRTGGFHDYLLSGGDVAWCRRAAELGLKMGFCREAVVCHPVRAELKELIGKRRRVEGGLAVKDIARRGRALALLNAVRPRVPWLKDVLLEGGKTQSTRMVLKLICLVLTLAAVGSFERFRVLLGGKAKRS